MMEISHFLYEEIFFFSFSTLLEYSIIEIQGLLEQSIIERCANVYENKKEDLVLQKTKLFVIKWLPRWLNGKESTCQCRRCRRCGFDSWVGKIPWSGKWKATPLFLPRKFHGESLVSYSPWGHKELDVT